MLVKIKILKDKSFIFHSNYKNSWKINEIFFEINKNKEEEDLSCVQCKKIYFLYYYKYKY